MLALTKLTYLLDISYGGNFILYKWVIAVADFQYELLEPSALYVNKTQLFSKEVSM